MKDPHGGTDSHEQHLSLAQFKKLREQSAKHRKREPMVPQERGSTLPLSYAQERLWFMDQLGLAGPAYNLQSALRLEGKLDVGALERSLAELVRRHESLRTRFESIAGSPIQVIEPARSFALKLRNVSGLQEKDKALEVQRLSSVEAQRPFNLAKGPLLRASLLKLTHEEHVLLLTMHHIVSDGWSWAVLNRELGILYGAFCQGQHSPLLELLVQYADYAIWQRRWLQGEVLQNQLQFWRERLMGSPSELQLPTDRPRHSVATFKGARLSFELSVTLSRELEGLARHEGMTLFMILLAAYQVLLSRYCGQQDVVVGSPIAGRTHAQTEGLIGVFVNTLVFRTDLSGNPSFRQLLQRVKEVTLGAYAHQDLPFEKLVMELRPERNLTRQPIFQVALALQNYPQEQLKLPGLTWTRIDTVHATAQFDLTLHLLEVPGGLHGVFVYATDLFDPETIERMADHFRKMLEGVVTDPDCPIQRLPMLTAAERNQMLYAFNDAAVVYPQDRLIHELFEEQVERTPDAVAVVYEQRSLTYAELNSRANQLARYLTDQGVVPDQLVAICVERSLEMVVGLLGILKAGAAYVPLDPAYPSERLSYMLRDVAPKVLLTQERLKGRLPDTAAEVIALDNDWNGIADRIASNLDPRALGLRSHHLAYVIYTSGSTGKPKGAMNEHRALVNRLQWMQNQYQLTNSDRVLQKTPFSFDVSVWEFFWTLTSGARLIVARPEGHKDPDYLRRLIEETGVTTLHFVPSMLQTFVDEHRAGQCPSVRHVVCSGEELSPALQNKCLECLPQARLSNLYGPTETAIDVTFWECQSDAHGRVPIGRPISNTQMYVLDRQGQPVPIGVAGEIHIGGVGVGRGYLNRPELTAERFIADTFSSDPKARLYKTGDLGRWRADGAIEYLGRNDHQVKIRGLRIELGEIEAQLARHEQVKEAAVIAREDVSGEKRLVAYAVAGDPSDAPSVEALRAHLKVVLPEYMVPGAFVMLERLPLTPNGKLDRRALPAPEFGAYTGPQYEPPQGQVEEVLAGIWQALLRVERIGRHDNFFELGGHSLLVLKALFKINQIGNCALSVRDVYGNPTLRELATRICAGKAEDGLVDLSKEAALDAAIIAKPGLRRLPAQAVMLTGGTGFVGRFLLAQLLHDTSANIYCLVRAPSQHHALSRLSTTLAKWDLWRDEFASRIIAIPGDLRQPRLGLDELSYQMLSQRIDSIYHCATSMNHLETYAMAKAANVESASELLRLATHQAPKLINYISTLSIFAPYAGDTTRVVNEASSIDHERQSNSNGYAASKWVCEKIFMTADERGVPCNIFRLGFVWADTQHGRYDELQREYRVFKSCLLSGRAIKDYRYEMAPVPVDFVARAVVSLAARHSDGRGRFHISSSHMIDGVFERCNGIADTSLELMSLYEWICEIKRLHHQGRSLPVVPLIDYAFSMDEETFYDHDRRIRSARIQFDCAQTNRELEPAGIVAPVFNDDLLRLCVESMLSRDVELREWTRRNSNLMLSRGR